MATSVIAQVRKPAKAPWRLKTTFWLDMILVVSVCVLQTIRFTGLILHEWIGLAIIGMVVAHLLFSWSWIASLSMRLFSRQSARTRINYLLNLSLFGAVTASIFSGILISRYAVPELTGTKAAPVMDWRWDYLHSLFSQTVLVLSGLHFAMNWNWVLAAGEKLFSGLKRDA